jgi:DNA repair protein RecO (recombination protein O)
MTANAIHGQPSFILRQKKYRETSLIIDVLTRDFGRISLLARGVRTGKSKTAAALQSFTPLTLSYTGGGELKILTDVNDAQFSLELKGLALYCGFYINELIIYFLHQYDPHPELFFDYNSCLVQLADADGQQIQMALRLFELNLIEKIGYGLQLEYDFQNGLPINPKKNYAFDVEQGAYEDSNGYLTGHTLQALSIKSLSNQQVLLEAKRLMRDVIDFHLQGRPLKSRQVINQIIKRTTNEQ